METKLKKELVRSKETAWELHSGDDDRMIDVRELAQAMNEKHKLKLLAAKDKGKEVFDGDFFLAVLTKDEPIIAKQIGARRAVRRTIVIKLTCPTPHYDMAVYKYTRKNDELNFVFAVPDPVSCLELVKNRTTIHPDMFELLKMVIDKHSGALEEYVKKINNEEGKINDLVISIQDEPDPAKIII